MCGLWTVSRQTAWLILEGLLPTGICTVGELGWRITFQDTLQVRPVALILDVLSRKVLAGQYPTPAAKSNGCIFKVNIQRTVHHSETT